MKQRRLIRTDGTEVLLSSPITSQAIAQMIGAESLDHVNLHHLGSPLWVMCVDDRGYETECVDHGNGHYEMRPVRAIKPVNAKATALYLANCVPGTTHQILGDVVIAPDMDFA